MQESRAQLRMDMGFVQSMDLQVDHSYIMLKTCDPEALKTLLPPSCAPFVRAPSTRVEATSATSLNTQLIVWPLDDYAPTACGHWLIMLLGPYVSCLGLQAAQVGRPDETQFGTLKQVGL